MSSEFSTVHHTPFRNEGTPPHSGEHAALAKGKTNRKKTKRQKDPARRRTIKQPHKRYNIRYYTTNTIRSTHHPVVARAAANAPE